MHNTLCALKTDAQPSKLTAQTKRLYFLCPVGLLLVFKFWRWFHPNRSTKGWDV